MGYSDLHRAVLQHFMSHRGVLTIEETRTVVNTLAHKFPGCLAEPITPNEKGNGMLKKLLEEINKEIGLEGIGHADFKYIRDDSSKVIYWGLVSSINESMHDVSLEETKLFDVKELKNDEVEYVKKIIEMIVTNPKFHKRYIDHNKAINCFRDKVHPAQAAKIIERLLEQQWLRIDGDEDGNQGQLTNKRLTLGPRLPARAQEQ